MNPLPISVLIIGQDVERCLDRCLSSAQQMKEVVFVDGGSTDRTEQIARSYPNVSYYRNSWPGFIEQRNFSLEKARNHWCLMLDTDEALTPELITALAEVIERKNPKAMYRIMRTEYYEGIAIEKGFGRSNYQERLFQKPFVEYVGGNHHEHLIKGKRSSLDHPEIEDLDPSVRILHDEGYKLDEMIRKLPRFSLLIAQEKFEKGRRVSAFGVFFSFLISFIQIYGKSWHAGRVGFMTSLLEAHHRGLVKMIIYNLEHFRGEALEEEWRKKKLG